MAQFEADRGSAVKVAQIWEFGKAVTTVAGATYNALALVRSKVDGRRKASM